MGTTAPSPDPPLEYSMTSIPPRCSLPSALSAARRTWSCSLRRRASGCCIPPCFAPSDSLQPFGRSALHLAILLVDGPRCNRSRAPPEYFSFRRPSSNRVLLTALVVAVPLENSARIDSARRDNSSRLPRAFWSTPETKCSRATAAPRPGFQLSQIRIVLPCAYSRSSLHSPLSSRLSSPHS